MEGKKKLGLPSVVATGVGVIVATSCLREHPKVCVNLQTDVR